MEAADAEASIGTSKWNDPTWTRAPRSIGWFMAEHELDVWPLDVQPESEHER
jgi:hypothetical protein